jgi:hypothetical protein
VQKGNQKVRKTENYRENERIRIGALIFDIKKYYAIFGKMIFV